MKKSALLVLAFIISFNIYSQETFPVNDVRDERTEAQAFINATIFSDYQTVYHNATLLIKEGKVVALGTSIPIPAGYVVNDLQGKFIYPSLIDPYQSYGMPAIPRANAFSFNSPEQIEPETPGAYNANEAIKSQFDAANNLKLDPKEAKTMRSAGFATVSSFRADGVARGTSVVVTLGDDNENKSILKGHAATYYSLRKGSSSQSYPISIMGAVALLRQTHYDARWYASQKNPGFVDQSLEMFNANYNLPQIIETRDWQEALTADRFGDDLGLQYIIKGSGDEYKRINEIKATGATFIVPLDFPKDPDVADPLAAEFVTLQEMLHWELAPGNPSVMEKNQVPFAITSTGLSTEEFWKNLRKAIDHGLTPSGALKALTEVPAALLGIGQETGSLRTGKMANFLIASDSLFSEETVILDHWIRGKKYQINAIPGDSLNGNYQLSISNSRYPLELKVKGKEISGSIKVNDTTKIKVDMTFEDDQLGLRFNLDPKAPEKGQVRLTGWRSGKDWKGTGVDENATVINWQAQFIGPVEADTVASKTHEPLTKGQIRFPFRSFGGNDIPQSETLLFRNATVWTNEDSGVLTGTDVLVQSGKIARIGQNIPAVGARVIDATGMHLTSGIIDEHSHVALKNVNDIATISAMVRMSDVIDSEDINIYRQLAGGVTASQLLHGSANPVGGQSAIVKMKWGETPQGMLIREAAPFIKFALGENVKRSSNKASIRYPQTRMGVEQVYMDGFTRAKQYAQEWKAYQNLSSRARSTAIAPRRDLAMEALAEVLEGRRFVTCHSYVQSEINMLMKLAERFNFKINTFTHILEGYKVADKMQAHGVGASTFSDWWAYKFEVIDAIPYNASLMTAAGVVTAINSDNAEMGRRLNQEAAKSIKYGGMSEEDAWKMVTLNPARLLKLDHRLGSIKPGKDADLVLWTDNPLSVYAQVQSTIIDGAVFFDRDKDAALQTELLSERNRLIQKILQNSRGGNNAKSSDDSTPEQLHCDDLIYEIW